MWLQSQTLPPNRQQMTFKRSVANAAGLLVEPDPSDVLKCSVIPGMRATIATKHTGIWSGRNIDPHHWVTHQRASHSVARVDLNSHCNLDFSLRWGDVSTRFGWQWEWSKSTWHQQSHSLLPVTTVQPRINSRLAGGFAVAPMYLSTLLVVLPSSWSRWATHSSHSTSRPSF